MNSIRTKMTLLTVCAIVVALTIATFLGVVAIRNIGHSSSNQMLLLLCESGEKNLDSYFASVEQSVEMVSAYVEMDLEGLDLEKGSLEEHLERAKDIFGKTIHKTNGVLTYYYRFDPAVLPNAKGFWFVNLDGEGFEEREPTDISLYDTTDTSQLVWFTIPKVLGFPMWLFPYTTENLNMLVVSYNMPIHKDGEFIGVVGIEIDYSTMAEQVDNITLYENGYAFINDSEGNIIYHPHLNAAALEKQPIVPAGLLKDESFLMYKFDGVEKQAVWLPLNNGMRLNVTVPVSEINAGWHQWVYQIFAVFLALLVVFTIITMHFTGQITKPLRELTEAAGRVNAGDYDCMLDYNGNDEVGILTKTFSSLIQHLKAYIGDLNDLAYADALTSVRNKGAFDTYAKELQTRLDEAGETIEFAVVVFDCNNLKTVNDQYGHDKGDTYLKTASRFICHIFQHSPIFRTGGDEFATILEEEDFRNREQLARLFDEKSRMINAATELPWEKVNIAMGIAVHDAGAGETVLEVMRRADKLMYEDKRAKKQNGTVR
ncbi:MAG: diguanylate cyclase [Lachnospiraceae bacterium]|nr:diguanylate cyclase [Lachnospiraceae bacterium]